MFQCIQAWNVLISPKDSNHESRYDQWIIQKANMLLKLTTFLCHAHEKPNDGQIKEKQKNNKLTRLSLLPMIWLYDPCDQRTHWTQTYGSIQLSFNAGKLVYNYSIVALCDGKPTKLLYHKCINNTVYMWPDFQNQPSCHIT